MELAGVEPASKHGDHTLSTCLVLLVFRDLPAAEQANRSLVPDFLVVRPEQSSDQPWIPCASWSGWNGAWPPGRRPVPEPGSGIKPELLYSLRQRERNYIRQLLFCDTVQATCHHTLHAYIPPLMLSKPCQPLMMSQIVSIPDFPQTGSPLRHCRATLTSDWLIDSFTGLKYSGNIDLPVCTFFAKIQFWSLSWKSLSNNRKLSTKIRPFDDEVKPV